jgi:hypothetical protein
LLKKDKFKIVVKIGKTGCFVVVECHCITTGSTYDIKHNSLFQYARQQLLYILVVSFGTPWWWSRVRPKQIGD